MRPGLRLAAAAAALIALLLAACGTDEPDPGPAVAAPEDASLYVEATVKLDEADREALQSSLGTLLGEADVEARLGEGLDELFEDESFTWTEDIEPWAGERAALFLLDVGDDPDGAAVFEVEDEDAATETLERLADGSARADGSYEIDDDDEVAAIVEGHAVFGTDAGVAAAIEAAEGGSLADSERFEAATAELADDRLATVLATPASLLDLLVESGDIDRADRARIVDGIGAGAEQPLALSFAATAQALHAEIANREVDPLATSASELIERAPEEAWLAFGLGGIGAALEPALAAVGADSLETGIGLDPPRLAAATADLGGFFAGTSLFEMTGAIILSERDEGSLAEPLAGLERGLEGDPAVRVEPHDLDGEGFTLIPADVPIQYPFVLRDGLLVAALGTNAVGHSFDPETSISDSEDFERAAATLGGDFEAVAYLDFDRLVELLGSLPGFWDDPEMASARPYIERLGRFVAGVREEGGTSIARMVLGIDGGEEG